jgi:hypothetical protein
MEAFTTMPSLEAFASMGSHVGASRHYTSTVEAAVLRMARPVVGAVIEVIVVVSFMLPAITTAAPIARVVPTIVTIVASIAEVVPTIVTPVGKVPPITMLPIAKVTKVTIKIMVAVAKEEKRREAHVKR